MPNTAVTGLLRLTNRFEFQKWIDLKSGIGIKPLKKEVNPTVNFSLKDKEPTWLKNLVSSGGMIWIIDKVKPNKKIKHP